MSLLKNNSRPQVWLRFTVEKLQNGACCEAFAFVAPLLHPCSTFKKGVKSLISKACCMLHLYFSNIHMRVVYYLYNTHNVYRELGHSKVQQGATCNTLLFSVVYVLHPVFFGGCNTLNRTFVPVRLQNEMIGARYGKR